MGREIKATVKGNVGIPVTVGMGPSKTLAKMANRFAKKTKKHLGVHVADTPVKIEEMLRFTAIGDVWGIGGQHTKMLLGSGFKTAYDLLQAPDEFVRRNMSVVGQRLLSELRGTPCIDWEASVPAKQMICVARGFGRLLTQKNEVGEALANYVSLIGEKLRQQGACAKALHIFVQTNAHRTQDRQYFRSVQVKLPVATNSTRELIQHASDGLSRIFKHGYNYQKTGCTAMELVPEAQIQFGMFDAVNRQKDTRLMQAVDGLNGLYGKNTLRFASQGYGNKWKLRQMKLSPCYTTRIDQVLTVAI